MGNLYRFRGPARGQLIHAALTALGTSLLFLVVYGGCSWLTAQRGDVGTWVCGWERSIPLVPLMIIPYMSIDLFFVAAPFVCRDREERRQLARRICLAILAAGACFVLMPLRFAFPRPMPGGWLGAIFGLLHTFDRPYNMFPSLHIALSVILVHTYGRHTRGPLRWLVCVWFGLIALSTLLTWQHHVVDVAGGAILALLCFYFVRRPTPAVRGENLRIGIYYLAGAALLGAAALALGGWALVLLWPALAMALAAAGYFGWTPDLFRKENGRLPLTSRCLLAPLLLGHWLSLRYYQYRADPWNEVVPGLWMGRRLNQREASRAVVQGVTAVLDLTAEFSEPAAFRTLSYLNLPVQDLTAPGPLQLAAAVAFIERERTRGTVYVHCKIGYSRSAAVVGAYLRAAGIAPDPAEAIARMRRARPSLVVRPEAERAIAL
jgi:membrane-associated phospholipid phosphatase